MLRLFSFLPLIRSRFGLAFILWLGVFLFPDWTLGVENPVLASPPSQQAYLRELQHRAGEMKLWRRLLPMAITGDSPLATLTNFKKIGSNILVRF